MNHIYRSLWSDALNAWVAVPEQVRAKGKSAGSSCLNGLVIKDSGGFDPTKIKFKLNQLAFVISLCFTFDGYAIAAGFSNSNITQDGRTGTQVHVSGNTANISTSTVAGKTGFNSFSNFVLGNGDIANLRLPAGTSNLVNVVTDSQTIINGVLNAYKDGRIGGNVFFADPQGMVVGSTGTINVGSLTIATPTRAFLDQMIGADGAIDAASTARLLSNDIPISSNGLITIRGKVNAPDGIALHGQDVYVSGQLTTSSAAEEQIALFEKTVNTSGISQGNTLVEHNGVIEILAQNAVEISGELRTDAAPGQNAGVITIRTTTGNIAVDNSAVLSAKGQGSNSNGGNITVFAGHDISVGGNGTLPSDVVGAVTAHGPQFDASAGSSGDGGTIETSAHATAYLHGGVFNTAAPNGKAGAWLVDPEYVVIDANSSVISSGINASIEAGISITVNSGATINTRKVASGADIGTAASTGDSGTVTLNAPKITMSGTIDAHATGNFVAGDVTLTATKTDAAFLVAGGFATASTSIDINGSINGKNILLQASSSATSSYTDGGMTMASSVAGDAASSVLGVGVGVVSGVADAYVKVHSGANIQGTRTVSLEANSIATAKDTIITLPFLSANPTSTVAVPAVVYGKVKADSTAQIESGATVSSGGTLTVRAHNTADLDISTVTVSGDTAVAVSVAYGTADVNSTAQIFSGATITAPNARVVARNDNAFSISATNYVLGNGKAGIVLAYADGLKSTATAIEGASLNLSGTVPSWGSQLLVEADSLTTKDAVSASTTVGAGAITRAFLNGADSVLGITSKLESKSWFDKLFSGDASTPKIASALALTLGDEQTAIAKIALLQDPSAGVATATAPEITATDAVVVTARVVDAGVKSSATSAVNSPNVDKATSANPSATFSISAGVAAAERTLKADAEVGSGVSIAAPSIGIFANDSLPLSITWLNKLKSLGTDSTWASPTQALGALASFANGNLGVCNNIATVCSNATGDASTVGFAGSGNYFGVTSNTTAWVGQGAKLTQIAANPAHTGDWTVNLDTGDDATHGAIVNTALPYSSVKSIIHNAAVSVKADSDVQAILIGGNFSVMLSGTGAAGSNTATNVGGAVNYTDFTSHTLAGIGSQATVTATDKLEVAASTNDYVISATPTSGGGGAMAVAGMLGMTTANDTTQASISNTANVTAAAIELSANEKLNIWTIAGAYQSANSESVGVAVAINDVTTHTRAYIGDNTSHDRSAPFAGPAPVAGISTDALDIESSTLGQIGAVAVAASKASSDTRPRSNAMDKSAKASKLDDFTSWVKAKLISTPSGSSDASFGLAVSGSAAVNMVNLDTESNIDGAKITRLTPAPAPVSGSSDFVKVAALRNTYIATGAGAAAMVRADGSTSPDSQSSAAVGGTAAIEVSANETKASIANSTITDFKDVTVQAVSTGKQIDIGVDFAANTTKQGDSNYSAAGSVSLAKINDGVVASIENSTIQGDAKATDRHVSVAAYDRTDIGIGGGSLYAGGKGGGSVAISMLLLGDAASGSAADAHVTGSTISEYDTLKVAAINSDRIIIGAATGGAASEGNGFSGAIVYDDISRTTSALIGSSTSSHSDIHTTGDITVTASGDNSGFDPVAPHVSDLSNIDFSAADAGSDLGAGAAIISVAGVVQYGKNNAGVSYVQNVVKDKMLAQISNAKVTSDNGAIDLTANNETKILALSLGAGIAKDNLAATLSATYNNISNETSALIGADPTTASATADTALKAASLKLTATDASKIQSLAGNVTINTGKGAALGGAVAYNTIGNSTVAKLSDYALSVSGDSVIEAASTGKIESIAISGAATKGNAALSGSATINAIDNTIEAGVVRTSLNDSQSVSGDLKVKASDTTTIQSLAGAIAASTGGAAGLAAAINLIGQGGGEKISAYIGGNHLGKQVNARNVALSAQSNATIKTLSAGIAVAETVGAAGSLSTNLMDTDVSANIDNGAQVTAQNNMSVLAGNLDQISVVAGSVGVGLKAVGVGLSVVVNDIEGRTQAYISGAATKVDAKATNLTDKVRVNTGNLATAFNASTVQAPTDTAQDLSETTEDVTGLAVVATSQQSVNANAFSLGLAVNPASLGASAVAVVNIMGGKTRAYIDGATVDTSIMTATAPLPSITVTASSHSYAGNFVIGIAGGGFAATGSMAVNKMDRTTDAHISGAAVGATGKGVGTVTVTSIASQAAADIVVGLAAGVVGGAASGIVNVFAADTQAYVDKGAIRASNLNVSADSNVSYNGVAGAVAGGGAVGAAGTFVVANSANTTKAYVGDKGNATALTLSGDLMVSATAENDFTNYAVAGAGAGTAAVAGMADVNLLNNTTTAGLYDVTANGGGVTPLALGNVTVSASETMTIKPTVGGLAGGGAVGIGAGANIVIVKSSVASEVVNSNITASGDVTVLATSDKTIDTITAIAGIGGTAGISGVVALVLIGNGDTGGAMGQLDKGGTGTVANVNDMSSKSSYADGNSSLSTAQKTKVQQRQATISTTSVVSGNKSDTVQASIDSTSQVTAAKVNVEADSTINTANTVGTLAAGGGAGVSGAVAFTRVYDNVSASSQGTITAPVVTVTAAIKSGNSGAKAYAGAAGLVGLGAAVADTQVTNTVKASVTGTLTGDSTDTSQMTVQASDESSVSSETLNFSGGAVAAGVVLGWATKSSDVQAELLPVSVNGYNAITVQASNAGKVSTDATAAAGGLASGVGVDSQAKETAKVTAKVGGTFALGNGTLRVSATDTIAVSARAIGVSAGAAAIGASIATASAAPTVTASVADNAKLTGRGSVMVTAEAKPQASGHAVSAEAYAGTGGLLLGASATYASAKNDADVAASIGNSVTLPDSDVSVKATNISDQYANAMGLVFGGFGVAIGADIAYSSFNGTTRATLGSKAVTSASRRGNLLISAVGKDNNTAKTTAGTGGMLAGNASVAETSDTATTTAELLDGDSALTLYTGTLSVQAEHTDTYTNKADSLNAAMVGASGAYAKHAATSTVESTLGDHLHIEALGKVSVDATNRFVEAAAGDSAMGAAGGVLVGAAVISENTFTAHTHTEIGDGVTINSGTNPLSGLGGIEVYALNDLKVNDTTSLTTGGAIGVAAAETSINTDFSDNTVTIGKNNNWWTWGNTGVGTQNKVDSAAHANANTWGIAGVGLATANNTVASAQRVAIGDNTKIKGFGTITLTAGEGLDGLDSSLSIVASAQSYVRALVAVPHVDANRTISRNDATLTLGTGSDIGSAQNVILGAFSGNTGGYSDGTGHGFELGFIPLTVDGSHDSVSQANSTVTANGTVTAGIFHKLDITIKNCQNSGIYCDVTKSAPAGSPPPMTINVNGDPYAPFVWSYDAAFNASQFVVAHFDQTAQAALNSPSPLPTSVPTLLLSGLYAAGGVVNVHAATLNGKATIKSYGEPTISVVNKSPDYLVIGKGGSAAFIPDSPGGKVYFSGSATAPSTWTVETQGAGKAGSTTIHNAYANSTDAPPLFLNGSVSNLGGTVNIINANGSLGQTAAIDALDINVSIPNGVVAATLPAGETWRAGSDPLSFWTSSVYALVGDPTDPEQTKGFAPNTNTVIGKIWTLSGGRRLDDNRGQEWWWYDASWPNKFAVGQSMTLNQDVFSSAGYGPTTSASSNIYRAGRGLYVTADYIDINAPITVGRDTNQSVVLSTLGGINYASVNGGATKKIVNVANDTTAFDTSLAGGDCSNQICAQYNVNTGKILLNNVSASSSGVNVMFDGKILSTLTDGKLRINGGLGNVTIENDTALSLVVRDVNVGAADRQITSNGVSTTLGTVVSTVDITDRAKDPTTNHWLYQYDAATGKVTSYNGQQGSTLTNSQLLLMSNDAASFNQATGASTVTYSPLENLRYEWKMTAELTREVPSSGWVTPGSWKWVIDPTTTLSAINPWTYAPASSSLQGTTSTTPLKVGDRSAFQQIQHTDVTKYAWWTANYEGDNHLGHLDPKNGGLPLSSTPNHFSSPAEGFSPDHFFFPTAITLTMTNSVKADNPIPISFFGGSKGSIGVTSSRASVTLDGALTNPDGKTTLSAASVDATTKGKLSANQLVLSADGALGSAYQPLNVVLSKSGIVDGSISATGGAEGVYLNLNSAAVVNGISSYSATKGYGDVVVNAAGDLAGAALANGYAHIVGRNITLDSNAGSIGSPASPLIISAQGTPLVNGGRSDGVVNATAMGGIDLKAVGGSANVRTDSATGNRLFTGLDGDLYVGKIASPNGSVNITVPNGRILDASGLTAAQTLTESQAQAVWDDLHMTGAKADIEAYVLKTSVTVSAAAVNTAYNQFWALKADGTVTNGVFTLDPVKLAGPTYRAAAAAALGQTVASDADVQSWANKLYESYATTFAKNVGTDWATHADFITNNSAYKFVVSLDQIAARTEGAIRTEDQLRYTMQSGALGSSQGTTSGNVNPNIVGHDVTLISAGSIGVPTTSVQIANDDFQNASLTSEQKAALALANTAGAITQYGVDANGNVVYYSYGDTPAGVTNKGIRVAQTAPLFVNASGVFSATSGERILVQGTDGSVGAACASNCGSTNDLTLGTITANGDVTLIAPGSILAAAGGGKVTTSNVLILAAGVGSIGSASSALAIAGNPLMVTASAGQNVFLSSDQTINLDRVSAGATAKLTSGGSILGFDVRGQDVSLNAAGDIGSSSKALQVDVAGTLDATATGYAYLTSPGTLKISSLSADQGVNVITSNPGADLGAQNVSSTVGAVSLTAGGNLQFVTVQGGGDVALTTTGTGNLTGTTETSTTGAITNTSAGTLTVATLTSAQGSTLTAVGNLVGGTLAVGGDANITSSNGSVSLANLTGAGNATVNAHGDLTVSSRLQAAGDIGLIAGGTLTEDLNASVQSSQGKVFTMSGSLAMGTGATMSAQDAISLATNSGDMVLGELTSQRAAGLAVNLSSAGAIVVNAGGQPNVAATATGAQLAMSANGDIGSTSHSLLVDVPALDANSRNGGIWMHDLRSMTSNNIQASGNVALTVDGNLQFAKVQGGGDIALTTTGTGNLTGTTETSTTGAITNTSAGTLTVANLTGAQASTLTAVGELVGGTLAVGGDSNITSSNGSVSLANLTGAGNATVNAHGDLTVSDKVLATGTVSLTAGGNLQFAKVQGGGDVTLTTRTATTGTGNLTGTELTSLGGAVTVNSAGDLSTTTVRADGDIQFASGGDLSIGTAVTTNGSVALQTGKALNVNSLSSNRYLNLKANGNIDALSLAAKGDIDLHSSAGNVDVQNLAAPSAMVRAPGSVRLGDAQVTTGVVIAADTVKAKIRQNQAGTALPLQVNVTGYLGDEASSADLEIHPDSSVDFVKLLVHDASIVTDRPDIKVVQGNISGVLSVLTPSTSLYMNNQSIEIKPVDLQLYQPGHQFSLDLQGKNLKTNGYVLKYQPGYMVNVDNYVDPHLSVLTTVNGISAVIDVGTLQEQASTHLIDIPMQKVIFSDVSAKDRLITISKLGGVNSGTSDNSSSTASAVNEPIILE